MNVNWKEIDEGCKELYKKLPKNKYDGIVCIATGGIVPGKILSELLDLPLGIVVSKRYNEGKKPEDETWYVNTHIMWNNPVKNPKNILLVDDIIEEGRTIQKIIERFRNFTAIQEIDLCVLFYKPTKVKVSLDKYKLFKWKETRSWIVFPWERC